MVNDKFIVSFIQEVKKAVDDVQEDLSTANVDNLYQVGRLQGKVMGLRAALEIINFLYEEQDV